MRDLREEFRTLDRLETPDLWLDVKNRKPRTSVEPKLEHRLVTAVVAIAIGVSGVAVAVQGLRSGSSRHRPTSSATPSVGTTPVTARVVDRIDVSDVGSGQGGSIAYGNGSIWLSVSNDPGSGGSVLRIDPHTDEIIATIPTSVVPGWEIGGGGLFAADGGVWVVGLDPASTGTQGTLVRIDPSTNQVADTITLKEGKVADVTVDPVAVWALLSGNPGRPEVVRIDPSTDQVIATIPLNGGYGRFIFAEGGSVFAAVAGVKPGGPFNGGTLVRIDPSTNEVSGTFNLGEYPSLAQGDAGLWAVTDRGLNQIDQASGQPIGTPVDVPATGDALAVGAGGVWFFNPQRGRALGRFDPSSGTVDISMGADQGTGGSALAASPGSVWIVNGHTLTRVDID